MVWPDIGERETSLPELSRLELLEVLSSLESKSWGRAMAWMLGSRNNKDRVAEDFMAGRSDSVLQVQLIKREKLLGREQTRLLR